MFPTPGAGGSFDLVLIRPSMPIGRRARFVYHRTMPVDEPDGRVSSIAAAIGEPARARMLYCLLDGCARTATELAAVADVAPSTTSAHLRRLEKQRLVKLVARGKRRYFSLEGVHVAAALEALSVLAGGSGEVFVPNTPGRLRAARTCYDHIAGTLGVLLHDRLRELRWLFAAGERAYDLTPLGVAGLEKLGIDVESIRALRRRFAAPCLDWSERRYHLAGALGAALLGMLLKRKWILRDLDSRILTVTPLGRRELRRWIGIETP
jgi:DNA-binding transcriptional ArsR family regulator